MFCQVAASEKEKSSGTPAGESKSSKEEETDKATTASSNNKSESKEATASNGKNAGDPLNGPSSSKKGSTHQMILFT